MRFMSVCVCVPPTAASTKLFSLCCFYGSRRGCDPLAFEVSAIVGDKSRRWWTSILLVWVLLLYARVVGCLLPCQRRFSYDNQLASLPSGIFDKNSALTSLCGLLRARGGRASAARMVVASWVLVGWWFSVGRLFRCLLARGSRGGPAMYSVS